MGYSDDGFAVFFLILFIGSLVGNVILLAIVTSPTTFHFDSCTVQHLNDAGKLVWECIKTPK